MQNHSMCSKLFAAAMALAVLTGGVNMPLMNRLRRRVLIANRASRPRIALRADRTSAIRKRRLHQVRPRGF